MVVEKLDSIGPLACWLGGSIANIFSDAHGGDNILWQTEIIVSHVFGFTTNFSTSERFYKYILECHFKTNLLKSWDSFSSQLYIAQNYTELSK